MDVLFLALDLACAINSPHAAEQLILGADFRKVCAISDFQKKLAQILKKLGDHEWYQVSKTMIDQVMSATGQGNPTQV